MSLYRSLLLKEWTLVSKFRLAVISLSLAALIYPLSSNSLPANRRVSAAQAPTKIYHWTTFERAIEMANLPINQFPLKQPISSILTSFNGAFRSHNLLFFWTHPITAVATNTREIIGR